MVLFARYLLVAVSIVASSTASAAGPDFNSAPGDAVFFSIPDVWPWAYEDDAGELKGSLIEVVNRLSEMTGVPVVPQLRPLRRAIVELRTGEANFTILFQNPELDVEAINVASVTRVNILLAGTATSEHPLALGDLKGQRVAYIRGTYLGEVFEHDTEVAKVPVSSISQAVDLLNLGRISAILASDHNIYRTLSARNLSRDSLRYSEHVSGQNGTLYMSKVGARPDVAQKFSSAIEQMDTDGELRRIFFGQAMSSDQQDPLPSAQ